MGSAMMRPTTQVAFMMVEIAVSMPTLITALTAYVTIKKIVLLGLSPLLLETVSVMMRPTMLTAIMMAVTAVYMTPILNTALIVLAITIKLVLQVFLV